MDLPNVVGLPIVDATVRKDCEKCGGFAVLKPTVAEKGKRLEVVVVVSVAFVATVVLVVAIVIHTATAVHVAIVIKARLWIAYGMPIVVLEALPVLLRLDQAVPLQLVVVLTCLLLYLFEDVLRCAHINYGADSGIT